MIGELEQVPRRKVEYRGVVLEEMDLDAVLKRRPTVALVDELAHTNAPGSRHAKRYQDVEELLRAGISVITTMNVQHLESLYDMVEKFTGVKVEGAGAGLRAGPGPSGRQRGSAGRGPAGADAGRARFTRPERAERALEHFFTEPNLNQLREIALEQVAHVLDRRRQERDRDAGERTPRSG